MSEESLREGGRDCFIRREMFAVGSCVGVVLVVVVGRAVEDDAAGDALPLSSCGAILSDGAGER